MSGQEWKNKLYYGDNLDVMRQSISDESIDLIYLDPPFKSDANYNLLFRADGLSPDEAQWTAFKDTWNWDEAAAKALAELQDIKNPMLVGLVNALAIPMDRTPMLAYIVNMALRLLEMRKKLKLTGSLYLHCDPTASHYLKLLMDAIFGPLHFKNEIIWKRSSAHSRAKRWGPVHDVLLFYSASEHFTWNRTFSAYEEKYLDSKYRHEDENGRRYRLGDLTGPGTRKGDSGLMWREIDPTSFGRHWEPPPDRALPEWFKFPEGWSDLSVRERLEVLYEQNLIRFPAKSGGRPEFKRYLQNTSGNPIQDVITDISPINSMAEERLGYPTQKPEALLERIIKASSNEGDLVLDPFCGCGTTITVAQRLKRHWIGIDISPFAIQLIRKKRIEGAFPGLKLGVDYVIDGLPTTIDGARLLAEQDKKAFEIWAVAQIDGIPNEKKGAAISCQR